LLCPSTVATPALLSQAPRYCPLHIAK
jgi:hypothetical protein